jgi:hypothetical protein
VIFVPELIDLLGVDDAASVVSLCDAMLPRKERTSPRPAAAPVQGGSRRPFVRHVPGGALLCSLEVLCCFADLRLCRHKMMRIKRERFLPAPKQKHRTEFFATVEFGIAHRIDVEISDPKLALSWYCPDANEDTNHTKDQSL